jgi:ATP-dependent exoDNAse (exonuclease V) beta subunit
MNKPTAKPPDQAQRNLALDPGRSILVQAPAGSGKTDLLTRRFLCLLGEVDDPTQIVAITFTNAAAAEMRNRIHDALERAATGFEPDEDEFSMSSLALRALNRSRALNWNLLNLPAQLRVTTIDSFCRELALQQPLLSGLGGGLAINEQPKDLYRRAARGTLEKIDETNQSLSQAIEDLLLWRDNGWQDMEDLLVTMLSQRDRWMHDFVLGRELDEQSLRAQLERPFARAVREALHALDEKFDHVPGARERALELARFACAQSGNTLYGDLAELTEFPFGSFSDQSELEEARVSYVCLAQLLLTGVGAFRKQVDKRLGFPADRKQEKGRLLELIAALAAVPGLEESLAAVRNPPPARYTEEDWQIVRACFTLLRHAAAELQVAFAETGTVDFIEVAQIAQRVLIAEDGFPSDAAIAVSDNIRHLLVDEFQDTSRRQHQLLAGLVAAWPDRTGRTCFAVGDPMQSIYFFRDADAELFPRVRDLGLEIPNAEPLHLDSVRLKANFRTAPKLVVRLNEAFGRIFGVDDSSGISFESAEPAREEEATAGPHFDLHLEFVPQSGRGSSADPDAADEREAAHAEQTAEIVELIRSGLALMEEARAHQRKYRVAVLARAKKSLLPIAEALRAAAIPFRAIELETLATRPEVLDALALARALLNPQDRVAWLGVLRAPWCGLALDDLHRLSSNDNEQLLQRPVPDLLAERLPLLSDEGRVATMRVIDALNATPTLSAALPTATLGTWLQQIWLRLGGADCVDATARANLDLLWTCIDSLPGSEQDLLGPTLHAALDRLTALPDPAASSECGVQLMTIHKSKGLEFEVVIVPDLQAHGSRGGVKMLSWLERGLAHPDDSGEITEFLVAPLQSKGEEGGAAKKWVDRIYHQRESQEDRRILYVAATRAREQLHLFARPAFKVESGGALSLIEPSSSLLATAWPALEADVRARFEGWKSTTQQAQGLEIAASGGGDLIMMPAAVKPTRLRRLPASYRPAHSAAPENLPAPSIRLLSGERAGEHKSQHSESSRLYTRHEGGLISRALGRAVHALLEELARLRLTQEWEPARAALSRIEPSISARIRSAGIDPAQANQIAAQALHYALAASRDVTGQWILSPHPEAASEVRWAGIVGGDLRIVQVDRVFRAGPAPQSQEQNCWWIVDYKTAHEDATDRAAALPTLRPLFAPQIEAYAQVLRNLHGKDSLIRAGLYYPRMLSLDWWEL